MTKPLYGIRATGVLRKFTLGFSGLGLASCLTVLAPLMQVQGSDSDNNSPRQSVKLLHIGNSFSNNATSFLPQIAKAGGKELIVAGTTLGGCTLERHAKHLKQAKAGDPEGSPYKASSSLGLGPDKKTVSVPEALAAQEWDFVTIQQGSRYSFRPESYEPFAEQLVAEIREKAPSATILIHQTWSYRPDSPRLKMWEMTTDEMFEKLVAAYQQLGDRYGLGFLPSGNAVYAASKTEAWGFQPDPNYDYNAKGDQANPKEKGLYPGNRWVKNSEGKWTLSNDASHLNTAGCYLIGCVWYEILFNDSVLKAVDFVPEGLTAEEAADLRRIAHETVAAYRAKGAL